MVEEKHLKAAHDIFVQNDYWKEVYDNAPTENAKKYVDLGFFISLYDNSEEAVKDFQESRKELLKILNLEELEYLCSVNGNNPGRRLFKREMEKFGGSTKCNCCMYCICRPESYKK